MVGGIGCDRNELVCVTWKYNPIWAAGYIP